MTVTLTVLNRLNVQSNLNKLDLLIGLVYSIDPKFDENNLINWMAKTMPIKRAKQLFKKAFSRLPPQFSFYLHSQYGWMILLSQENAGFESSILQVPYCLDIVNSKTNDPVAHIDAEIRVEDEIQLLRWSHVWWRVSEIRPQNRSILLIRLDEKCFLKGPDYKEIHLIYLLGCIVRRDIILRCIKHYPQDCNCSKNSTREKCVFQFPRPDRKSCLGVLKSLGDDNEGLYVGTNQDDHLYQMQRASFVHAWLEKMNNILAATKYLDKISPSLCSSRYSTHTDTTHTHKDTIQILFSS
jgi:hypothetical protein